MSRQIDPAKIHLKVNGIDEFVSQKDDYSGFYISWSSDIGFGEYTIVQNRKDWKMEGYSECMDIDADKAFLAELLLKARDYILENITILE